MSLNSAHEGYDYQDLLTSYFILKEILEGHFTSVFTIDKKNTSAGVLDKFDDLVITNGTKIQRKQIKYSNDSTDKTLVKDDLANDSGYGLAIYKLFEAWNDLRTPETEFRLCLAWNTPVDEDIKRILTLQNNSSSFNNYPTPLFKINLDNLWETNPEKFNRWNKFGRYVKEELVNRDLFQTFCDELVIELELPKASLDFTKPSDLEKILIEQAGKLGIEQYPNDDIYIIDFLVRLAKLVGDYRSKSKEVSVQDILIDLRLRTDYGAIEQKFKIDASKNIVISSKYQEFLEKIIGNHKSLLIGEPGAGKSWFLTNFIAHLEGNDSQVIRHYCFTSTEDDLYEERITSNVFFGNLINNIVNYYPALMMEKANLLTADLDELNLLLRKIDIPLVIIIDGLDHVERILSNSTSLSQDKTRIIDYISQIVLPSNVSIILGSQPVDEVQTLIDDHSFIKIDLPYWDEDDTNLLMERFSVEDIKLEEQYLSTLLTKKSQGNPLYLTYILKSITNQPSISMETLDSLPPYDFNLKSYYKYLSSQLEDNTTSGVLACLEFAVTRTELKEIAPIKYIVDRDLKVLNPVISENTARGGISLYHDSFRRFNIETLSSIADLNDFYQFIIGWLEKQGFYNNAKSYRYLLNYYIRSDRYKDILKYTDNEFLANSLYYGHPEIVIKNNFKHFLRVAEFLQDWSLFIYLSELNRTISTTSAGEHYSHFLESFDLYFEAICLIYGTEKANSLLFFNGEKNFNDQITAKAFSILQKNGYLPRWDEVSSLFDDEIELEHIKYCTYSLIGHRDRLRSFFLSIVEYEDKDFLYEIVIALVEIRQIDTILELYHSITNDEDERIARRINCLLEVRNLPQRLNLENTANIQPFVNQTLSIDFIDDHINSSELNKFYFNVSQYAKNDIEALIEFEKTIPSLNFFYNWLKYFINIFIIEYTVAEDEQEYEIVANLSFLASDVDHFKGTPRALHLDHYISGLLDRTIRQSLKHIESKAYWKEVIEDIVKLPFPALTIVERNFINKDNIPFIIEAYDRFGKSTDSDYYEYVENHFKKSIYYAKSDKLEEAKDELKKATEYTTKYTSRKDTTLSELIDPLTAINRIDPNVALTYAKKLKYLNDAVMKHTEDGKGIKWLVISWYKELLNIDYLLAKKYLINELIEDPYFWKLDYMFVDLLEVNKDINPLILNFLYSLLPTNNRDEYLNGFLDVISSIKDIDTSLAKSSLINLLSRDWNDSYNTLESKTEKRFKSLSNDFNLKYFNTKKSTNNIDTDSPSSTKVLSGAKNSSSNISDSVMDKSVSEIVDYYTAKQSLSQVELDNIYAYLQQCSDDGVTKVLLPIIKKRFPYDGKTHFDNILGLVLKLEISSDLRVSLLVSNFIHSKDGNFQRFVHKESLKKAYEIDKDKTLENLSKLLTTIYPSTDYMPKSTSNLIIAFEYIGIDNETIIEMYERGYSFIESRLPDENDFQWEDVEDTLLSNMNQDELAIVLMLSKTKHQDSHIQRTILDAIGYLIDYDAMLLIKPLKWLLVNIERFHDLSIASILELLVIEKESCHKILVNIKTELLQVSTLDNLYIKNAIVKLLEDINNG